ncbi:MAG: type IV pilin-like G/H family protein [Waterburya sp.]
MSTIILGVNTTSVSAQSTKKSQEIIEAKNFINSVNWSEQSFYRETGKFTDDVKQLELTPSNESYQYKLNLIDNGNLVQTIATPNEIRGFRTFTGALSLNKENFAFNSILCKSERVAKVIVGEIKLVDGQLKCPTGFMIAFHDVYREALSGVRTIINLEQAYSFQTGDYSFTKDTILLGFTPSNTYYDYTIDLSENNQLAQVKAVSKFDSLRSYIGAIYLEKDTGIYESIICASVQPTKNISQSIKLSNGKLSCPTGFKITGINLPQVGLNSVGTINRGQHAYHFETGNFAKDIPSLGFPISSTYFDFAIDILENGQLAQIKATPKLNNVNSYIGGILFAEKTGLYETIVCASNQPTKDNSQSIKLVDGKLACPTGFTMHSPY